MSSHGHVNSTVLYSSMERHQVAPMSGTTISYIIWEKSIIWGNCIRIYIGIFIYIHLIDYYYMPLLK